VSRTSRTGRAFPLPRRHQDIALRGIQFLFEFLSERRASAAADQHCCMRISVEGSKTTPALPRREDPAPVGIGAGDASSPAASWQWRGPSRGAIAVAVPVTVCYEFPRAFAVAGDGLRQALHHARTAFQIGFFRDRAARRRRHSPTAAAYRWWTVASTRAIVAAFHGPLQNGAQHGRRNIGVSSQSSVWPSAVDHAGAFVMPAMRTTPRRNSLRRTRSWTPGRCHDGAAASSKRSAAGRRPDGQASVILAGSSSTPMSVDAGSTCAGGSSAVWRPLWKWPALRRRRARGHWRCRRSPEWRPPIRRSVAVARLSFTGAACTRFCVNTAADAGSR